LARVCRGYRSLIALKAMLSLLDVLKSSVRSEKKLNDLLAVLLALQVEGVAGRPRLAAILRLGDRRVRNLLLTLRRLGVVRTTKAGTMLTAATADALSIFEGHYSAADTACAFNVPETFARIFEANVVRLRDKIAIILEDPDTLELLGTCRGSMLNVPGVPAGILKRILSEHSFLRSICAGRGETKVWALYRRGRCYRCCAALIQASAALSRSTGFM